MIRDILAYFGVGIVICASAFATAPRNNLEFFAKDGSQRYGSTNVWADPNDNGGGLYDPGSWSVGDTITIRLIAWDNDGNASSVRLIATGPGGAIVDETRSIGSPTSPIWTGYNLGGDFGVSLSQGSGRYYFRLIATDSTGSTDDDTWYLDVGGSGSAPWNNVEFWSKGGSQQYGSTNVWADRNDNGGPLYNPGAWAPGETMTIRMVNHDDDGNALRIRMIASGPNGTFIDDTRTVSSPTSPIWTANNLGNDFSVTFGQGEGRYYFRLIGTDATGMTDDDTWYIDVTSANSPPQTVSLQPSPSSALVGQSITLTARATDQNANLKQIHFYISDPASPGWQSIGSRPVSGADGQASFVWTPPANATAGQWSAHIRAEDETGAWDSNGNVMCVFTLSENSAPQTVSIQPASSSVVVGQPVTLTARATDTDGNLKELNFYISDPGNPGWQYIGTKPVSGSDGQASFVWTSAANANIGVWGAHVRAVDEKGAWDSNGNVMCTMTLIANLPPVIAGELSTTGTQGKPFTYTITASNSPYNFSATGLPGGLTVNSSTGVISGTPAQAGTFSVAITAANLAGTGSNTLVLTIDPPDPVLAPPVIPSNLRASGSMGTPFTYTIPASNSPTSFSATSLPNGLGINSATGTIAGTPLEYGEFSITIYATNASGTGSGVLILSIVATSQPDPANQNQLNVHLPLQP